MSTSLTGGVGVRVGVRVRVAGIPVIVVVPVTVGVAVTVAVAVAVEVGGGPVAVSVGVAVGPVGVWVGVDVGADDTVTVGVTEGVSVWVGVWVCVTVGVLVAGRPTLMICVEEGPGSPVASFSTVIETLKAPVDRNVCVGAWRYEAPPSPKLQIQWPTESAGAVVSVNVTGWPTTGVMVLGENAGVSGFWVLALVRTPTSLVMESPEGWTVSVTT